MTILDDTDNLDSESKSPNELLVVSEDSPDSSIEENVPKEKQPTADNRSLVMFRELSVLDHCKKNTKTPNTVKPSAIANKPEQDFIESN